MPNTIQHKRGTAAEWTAADPTLVAGQVGVETDTGKFKVGDGSTAWSALGYFEVAAAEAWSFQGENYGYASGGTSPTIRNTIQKYSFTSDANATDVGDTILAIQLSTGQSSTESGYLSGGTTPGVKNTIEKFPFATDTNSTDIADLLAAKDTGTGHSSSENGYSAGGTAVPTPANGYNVIEKFPFATDANATDVGDLLSGYRASAGHSSPVSGYVSGGYSFPNNPVNVIQKFSFATDANATDVGDLLSALVNSQAGSNSSTYGYVSGGYNSDATARINVIQKFSFETDGNSTDVGDLLATNQQMSATSSTSSGYVAGGLQGPPNVYTNVIQKFSFETDGNSTDVGNLVIAVRNSTSQQN